MGPSPQEKLGGHVHMMSEPGAGRGTVKAVKSTDMLLECDSDKGGGELKMLQSSYLHAPLVRI